MNKSSKVKGVLEILLVIGLILIIPLFFAIKTAANSQPAQNTPAPAVPATAQNIPPTSTITAQRPPACTFPLAQITAEESKPENYTFSEPKAVLTDPDNLYDIVEWLSDNQRVLVTQEIRDRSSVIIQQSIELYNPQTGETQVYAMRNQTTEPPSWYSELNAVVYPDTNVLGIDKINNRYNFTRQIRVSHGNPHATELIADNLPQFYVAVKPGGSELVYLSDKKISKRNNSLKEIPSTPFNSAQWDYAKGRIRELPVSYKMAWQPSTSLLFFYSDGDTGGGYTFILDSNTGQVCELHLGGWATRAHWSPNGRYLAITRYQGIRPTDSSDLAILDAVTGNLYTMRVTSQEVDGKHYVSDIAWAPDIRHILVAGSILTFQSTGQVDSEGLYLVDFISGQSDYLLPAYRFSVGSGRSNLAWSPDGSKLLVRCPTIEDERVCFISVQRSGQ